MSSMGTNTLTPQWRRPGRSVSKGGAASGGAVRSSTACGTMASPTSSSMDRPDNTSEGDEVRERSTSIAQRATVAAAASLGIPT